MYWQIISGVLALMLAAIGIIWGKGLWARREMVKIKITSISYRVDDSSRIIKVYWGGEFKRSGGDEIRYIAQILIKPASQTYTELQQYFSLPNDGVIRINERLELKRAKIVSSGHGEGAFYPDYAALPEVKEAEKWKTARQKSSELGQKQHKVCLVWEDGGKAKWRTISPKELGKWV
jgi:hypothetical protein